MVYYFAHQMQGLDLLGFIHTVTGSGEWSMSAGTLGFMRQLRKLHTFTRNAKLLQRQKTKSSTSKNVHPHQYHQKSQMKGNSYVTCVDATLQTFSGWVDT